jgi:gamma-glutamyl:cysteine ligase YbdK (ATP-grasp superfamily)
MGPEHEYSLVDQNLKPMPISDQIIKDYCGRTVNFIKLPMFTFGKELQLHVMEIKANQPFKSPLEFEENMHKAVTTLGGIVKKHGASLLGTGMHPLLRLDETGVWPHYHKKIYDQYAKIFNLKQHGWLNIQSFHLNLPFQTETDAITTHNHLCNLVTYLPAIAASSPFYEGKPGRDIDNRLQFYKINQKEVPSIGGDVIPEYAFTLEAYRHDIIGGYSMALAKVGADKTLFDREWVNSRGIIFRFDRSALEVRVMDEQECVKSDVALACFVRAALRGMLVTGAELSSHELLVQDFNAIIKDGLKAKTNSPHGKTSQQVCQHYLNLAQKHADADEKKYLLLIKRRIEEGNLSEVVRKRVLSRAAKTSFHEAITDIYPILIKCLADNQPYF